MQFTKASELPSIKDKALPRREERRLTCGMCGGESGPLCDDCIEGLVETKVEHMVEAKVLEVLGRLITARRLNGPLERVLDRHISRASVPLVVVDQELVDEVSGNIRD